MWPTLLDTCALQHLRYISEILDGSFLTDDEAERLRRRHGRRLGDEFVALGDLVAVLRRNGPVWLVSETSLLEFERATGAKGRRLLEWWWEWAHYMQGCIDANWYPEIDIESLSVRRGPDVHKDQLGFPVAPPCWPLAAECVPEFGPFRDAGDRALIRDAIRAGVPSILTTDVDSFWRYRAHLRMFGIKVLRPTELVDWLSPSPRSRGRVAGLPAIPDAKPEAEAA